MRAEVRLQITASMLEKLLHKALAQGAAFAAVHRSGKRSVIVDCDERSAQILLALCKKYRLDCKVLRKAGPSAMREKLRRRITLPAGLLLCILICCITLSRIWIIDIQFSGSSAELGRKQEISTLLDEMDIKAGMKGDLLDADLLQKQLTARAGNYSHIGVRRQGIRLLLEAVPEVPAPEIYSLSGARDLVASMDGVVCAVNVKSGQACVKVGDTVRRGQLLIRGEEAKSKEETAAVSALGEVYVRSWFEGGASGDLKEKQIRRTGRVSVSKSIRIFGWSLPLAGGEAFAQSEDEESVLPIVGLFLPLEVVQHTLHETQTEAVDADRKNLEQRLRAIAQAQARSKLSLSGPQSYEIVDYWEESTVESDTLRLRAVYEITSDIAVTRDALIGG